MKKLYSTHTKVAKIKSKCFLSVGSLIVILCEALDPNKIQHYQSFKQNKLLALKNIIITDIFKNRKCEDF